MKILFLTSVDHPQIRLESDTLSKMNIVDYIIIPTRLNLLQSRETISSLLHNLPKIALAIVILRPPPLPITAFLSNIFLTSHFLNKKELFQQKYDIIYAHWLFPAGAIALLLSKILQSKVVSVIWGYDIQTIRGIKYGINGIIRLTSKYVITHSKIVIANHKIHKQIASRLARGNRLNNIVYLPPAIPDIAFSYEDNTIVNLPDALNTQNVDVVLYSPSLQPIYGVLTFLNAVRLIASKLNNCLFVVVGDGVLKDESKKFVKMHKLTNDVIFTGRVDYNTMKSLYKKSTIVCDLSCAGNGTTTLEAFCFGKPVIGICTAKKIIDHGKNGFLIEKDDHHALAFYISHLLSNASLRHSMSENARFIFEQKFSMKKRVDAVTEILEKARDAKDNKQ